MSQLQVNASTGELVRSGGSFQRVDGAEEIAQHVRIGHRLIRGEIPTNLQLGMRFVGFMLGKGIPPARIEGEFIDDALAKPGVVSIDEISIDVGDDRVATVTYDATISVADARRRIPLHDTFTLED